MHVCHLTLCYRKAIKVALNACSMKSIHSAFSLSATELKPPSFYSARMGVPNGVSYEAQISSQGNQYHLEYTKEVYNTCTVYIPVKNWP